MRNIPKSKNLTLSNLLQNLCQNKGQIKETTVTIQGCGHGPKWILGLLATEVKQQLLSAVELLCFFFNFSLFVSNLAIPFSLWGEVLLSHVHVNLFNLISSPWWSRPPSPGSMTARRMSALDTSVINVFLGSMDQSTSGHCMVRLTFCWCSRDQKSVQPGYK